MRPFLKDKTWWILAGVFGLGLILLALGAGWFSPRSDAETADVTDESPIAEIQNFAPQPPPSEVPASAGLELRMPANEPLPLLKTVDQVLVQMTDSGDQVSRSSLELSVTMRLEKQAEDGSRLLSVVYNRVRYRQDVAGRTFVFDSTRPAANLPVEALPYKGLVGNGFSFWIGKDHRIIKPVGFAEFLKRCIQEVPPAQQQRVLMAFSDAADEGVANFVDDSIGFLPPDPNVKEADSWNRERRLTKPVPIYLNTQCTLKRLTDNYAEVDIDGTIAATHTFGTRNVAEGDLQVIVRGGRSQGRCEIDRQTGLPLHSEIKRSVDMEVKLAGGEGFNQQKFTTTTIRLFPQQSTPGGSPVIHASGEFPARD